VFHTSRGTSSLPTTSIIRNTENPSFGTYILPYFQHQQCNFRRQGTNDDREVGWQQQEENTIQETTKFHMHPRTAISQRKHRNR
jgi:hypothetical protein